MKLSENFPELNEGQLNMLARYISEREAAAIQKYKQTKS